VIIRLRFELSYIPITIILMSYCIVKRVMIIRQMLSFSHFISSSTIDIQISNVFKTRRGKRCFNIKNYKYSEFQISLKSSDVLFRSTNKKCTSRITVNKAYELINI